LIEIFLQQFFSAKKIVADNPNVIFTRADKGDNKYCGGSL